MPGPAKACSVEAQESCLGSPRPPGWQGCRARCEYRGLRDGKNQALAVIHMAMDQSLHWISGPPLRNDELSWVVERTGVKCPCKFVTMYQSS